MEHQAPGPSQRVYTPNDRRKLTSEEDDSCVSLPAPTVPVEVLDTVFEFLDGNGLLSCEVVSSCWRSATDRISLWKRACISAFPHLGDRFLASPYSSCSAYEGDWRETFLDGNRENRSAVLDWHLDMAPRTDGAGDSLASVSEEERRYLPPFSLCRYLFRLLADPGGNPHATHQAPGDHRVEKGLSVYLTVAFQDELQETPWWGSGTFASHGFLPPPMPPGHGHPWGANVEHGEGYEQATRDGFESADLGAVRAPHTTAEESKAGAAASSCASEDASAARWGGARAERTVAAATRSRRDPHGLRHRRRRTRTREGKAPLTSHVRDPLAVARECCAAFSLEAVNKGNHKGVMWVSSMASDRFSPERRSWGVHCLLPSAVIRDKEEGFLKDGILTVRLRLRLLYLTVHVYTTADLAAHRGFGVVEVRGNDLPVHFHGGGKGWGGNKQGSHGLPEGPNAVPRRHSPSERNAPVRGPLPCLTFEILRCTTLEEMEHLVARNLKVSRGDIRLWVITQPQPNDPLAPRQLLSEKDIPTGLIDDTQGSASLFRLLSGDTMDETCKVRLWVEHRGDGGFWEMETRHVSQRGSHSLQKLKDPVESLAHNPVVRHGRGVGQPSLSQQRNPMQNHYFAGVRLACTADMDSGQMQLLSKSVLGPPRHSSRGESFRQASASGELGASETLLTVAAESGAVADDADAHGMDLECGVGIANKGTFSHKAEREELMLVFLKTLGLVSSVTQGRAPASVSGVAAAKVGKADVCDFDAGDVGAMGFRDSYPRYLSHAVLRGSSPLRTIFELTAELLQDGTAPEDLEAYIEDLPWVWQGAALRASYSGTAERKLRGAASIGDTKRRNSARCRRFLACPPAASAVSPSRSRQPQCRSGIDAKLEGTAGTSIATECRTMTLEEAGISAGASVCFFRAGQRDITRTTYGAIVADLIGGMHGLLRKEGPLGRTHHIKLVEVVEISESLGYQGFRARIVHDQQQHVNARETLEYLAKGKHLAFICDSCGTQDFQGPRYHCLRCPDYDLCQECIAKNEPAPRHRYLFTGGRWTREGGYHGHTDDHELEEIFPVPSDGCAWRRRQQGYEIDRF